MTQNQPVAHSSIITFTIGVRTHLLKVAMHLQLLVLMLLLRNLLNQLQTRFSSQEKLLTLHLCQLFNLLLTQESVLLMRLWMLFSLKTLLSQSFINS